MSERDLGVLLGRIGRVADVVDVVVRDVADGRVEAAVGDSDTEVGDAADLRAEHEAEPVDVVVLVLRQVGGRRVAGGQRPAGADVRRAVGDVRRLGAVRTP